MRNIIKYITIFGAAVAVWVLLKRMFKFSLPAAGFFTGMGYNVLEIIHGFIATLYYNAYVAWAYTDYVIRYVFAWGKYYIEFGLAYGGYYAHQASEKPLAVAIILIGLSVVAYAFLRLSQTSKVDWNDEATYA